MKWFAIAIGFIGAVAFALIIAGLALRLGTTTKQMVGARLMATGARMMLAFLVGSGILALILQ